MPPCRTTKKIIINDELELTEFHQELTYILDNIKGNNNYGKEFVATVERKHSTLNKSGVKHYESMGSV